MTTQTRPEKTVKAFKIPKEFSELSIYRPSVEVGIFTTDNDIRLLIYLASLTHGPLSEMGCNRGITTFNLAIRFTKRVIKAFDWTGKPTMHEGQQSEQPPGPICHHAAWLPNVIASDCNLRTVAPEELGSVGFAFIDSDHSFDGVLNDTLLASRCLLPGGIIAWHDFSLTERPPTEYWLEVNTFIKHMASRGVEIQYGTETNVAFWESIRQPDIRLHSLI